MAKVSKKTENDLRKVIADVAKEEIGNNDNKRVNKLSKSSDKSVKNTIKKTTKKDNQKHSKKIIKKKEVDSLELNKTTLKGGRSRKMKEKLNDTFAMDSMIEKENTNDINIKNENVNVDDKKEINEDVNIKSNDNEKIEVINNENNNVSIKDSEKEVVNVNDIDVDEIFKDDDKEEEVKNKKNMGEPKEKKQISKVIFVGVVVIVILFFAIFIATKTMKTVIPNVSSVNSVTDLNKKLDASLVPPLEVKNVQYGIEGDEIARMDYARKSENGTMNLIFRMSKDPDKDLYGEYHNWGERIIHMDVECADGTIINVESYEALDDVTALIALWKDNNEYYSLFTKNVSTKEDFYREVNQIVAANHKA